MVIISIGAKYWFLQTNLLKSTIKSIITSMVLSIFKAYNSKLWNTISNYNSVYKQTIQSIILDTMESSNSMTIYLR
jgi:hypothetical protein